MSRFKNIDSLLEEFSSQLGATLSKDRPNSPESLRTFEERRIDWTENGIQKAIIIQPIFEMNGVSSNLWNFSLAAWKWTDRKRYTYSKEIIGKEDFVKIENKIEELLIESKAHLQNITVDDLW